MEVAIRDASFAQCGYPNGLAALDHLGVRTVEMEISLQGVVRSPVDGAELDLTTTAGLDRLEQELAAHRIRICALLCSQNFNHADRAAHLNWVIQAVRAADVLGVPALRIDSAMSGQDDLPLSERVRIFADAAVEVLRATPESEVALGIENHGRQGNDPEWMRQVLRTAASPRLGVTLDVGNWYWFGHPLTRLYEIYEEFAPVVKATHVKNIAYPEELRETQRTVGYEYGKYCCPLDEGDIDMERVARLLGSGGYDGPLTIEDESLGKFPEEQRAMILKRDVDHLTESIRRAGNVA